MYHAMNLYHVFKHHAMRLYGGVEV